MTMRVVHEPEAFRAACDDARQRGQRVGLVPTMGALHAGHMSLVAEAARRADVVAVSIFVNPTQFAPNEDLAAYPRTLDADAELCRKAGVSIIFAPTVNGMYPAGEETRVRVGSTAQGLCGTHRPDHFEGVATIVTKLFALTGPSVAVFGKKDYQQWRVIQRFVRDLFLPIEVVGAPIVREKDGIALSSRNAYLSAVDRQRALVLSRGLSQAVRAYDGGVREVRALHAMVMEELELGTDSIDYVTIADPISLAPLEDQVTGEALIAVAARIGSTRLIDNVVLGSDPPPTLTPSS